MKQTNKIKAVEMVRKIRDSQAKKLAKKTPGEIMEFFNRAGARAQKPRHAPERTSSPKEDQITSTQKYPSGWNENRVRHVLDYYESQSDEEAAAEIEAGSESILMEVPRALVPAIRRLIARRASAGALKRKNTTVRTPLGARGNSKSQKTSRQARG